MATQYPAKIDDIVTLPILVDGVHAINASVINRLREAIIAIEEELGESPASIYTNVKERLDNLDITFGSLQTITLAGDLGGTHAVPKVIGINGTPISNTAPTVNQGLVFNGSSWAPTNLAPGSLAFTAAGDLSGTESSQTVIGIQGRSVDSQAPSDGYLLTWEQSTTSWKPLPAPVSFSAGGDLSGTESSQTVIGIQGNSVANDAPTNNYVLVWEQSSTSWKPKSTNAVNQLPYLDIVGFANTVNTESETFIDAATFELDTDDLLAGTKTAVLRVVAETTGPLMTIQLYNVTAGGVVASSTITTSSTTPVSLNTGDIFSNLTVGQAIYKVQIKMDAGIISDRVFLAYAALRIEWT